MVRPYANLMGTIRRRHKGTGLFCARERLKSEGVGQLQRAGAGVADGLVNDHALGRVAQGLRGGDFPAELAGRRHFAAATSGISDMIFSRMPSGRMPSASASKFR